MVCNVMDSLDVGSDPLLPSSAEADRCVIMGGIHSKRVESVTELVASVVYDGRYLNSILDNGKINPEQLRLLVEKLGLEVNSEIIEEVCSQDLFTVVSAAVKHMTALKGQIDVIDHPLPITPDWLPKADAGASVGLIIIGGTVVGCIVIEIATDSSKSYDFEPVEESTMEFDMVRDMSANATAKL